MKSLSNKFKKAVVWMIATGFILTSCKVPDNSQGGSSQPSDRQRALELGKTIYRILFGPPQVGSYAYDHKNDISESYVEMLKNEDVGTRYDDTNLSMAVSGGNLRGVFRKSSKQPNSTKTVIAIHGLTRNAKEMLMASNLLRFGANGYNVFAPDLRGHGESIEDFPYKTMGIKDSQDILKWIDFLKREKGQKEFVLWGISLGAITSLQASAYVNPDEVKGIIEDCGFPDMIEFLRTQYEETLQLAKSQLPKEQWPMIDQLVQQVKLIGIDPVIEAVNYVLYNDTQNQKGEHLKLEQGVSKLRDVSNGKVPLLIIHGKEDKLMPFRMAGEIQNAYGYQSLIKTFFVDKAGHGESISTNPAGYKKAVNEFLEEIFE